jgi:hypothetical protein
LRTKLTKVRFTGRKYPLQIYNPSEVFWSNRARLLWDSGTLADETVSHKRQDITLFEKANNVVYLIDVSVPNSGNL